MKLDNSVLKTIKLVLSNNDIDLVDVEYVFTRKQRIIRFLIAKPDRIRISDCQDVTKMIEPILDVEGNVPGKYFLEVASPGLDRPLKTESDFRRVQGKLVKVIRDDRTIFGVVEKSEDGVVTLKDRDNKIIQIPITQIMKAQLEIKF